MKFEQMKRLCTQKRNYYLSILRKSKREFYGNINEKTFFKDCESFCFR